MLDAEGDVLAGMEGKLVCVQAEDASLKWEFILAGETFTTPCVGKTVPST